MDFLFYFGHLEQPAINGRIKIYLQMNKIKVVLLFNVATLLGLSVLLNFLFQNMCYVNFFSKLTIAK